MTKEELYARYVKRRPFIIKHYDWSIEDLEKIDLDLELIRIRTRLPEIEINVADVQEARDHLIRWKREGK